MGRNIKEKEWVKEWVRSYGGGQLGEIIDKGHIDLSGQVLCECLSFLPTSGYRKVFLSM